MAYMYTISQMLIYKTYSTYRNTKTTTIRNSKEHETPFLQCLNMHGDARLRTTKKQIKKSHELGGEGGGGQREDNDIWTTLNDASKACSLLLHLDVQGL